MINYKIGCFCLIDTNIPKNKMARIHARRNGKAGSTKPVVADLSFVTMKPAEIEKIIIELSNKDVSKSEIGLILRDSYAVPSVKLVCGKSISSILKENKMVKEVPEDLGFLHKKYQSLTKHLENNKKDTHIKRALQLIESKIRRFVKYYKRKNLLDKKWRYN